MRVHVAPAAHWLSLPLLASAATLAPSTQAPRLVVAESSHLGAADRGLVGSAGVASTLRQ
jgi:hypothetical protein